jgi:hypothetical protein
MTEAVGLAMCRLLDEHLRAGSLFGAHPESVLDAAIGREIER